MQNLLFRFAVAYFQTCFVGVNGVFKYTDEVSKLL